MAVFPANLPTYPVNPAGTDATSATLSGGYTHSGFHAAHNNEIAALAAKIGIDTSTVKTSHDWKLSDQAYARAYRATSNQSISSGTVTKIQLNAEDFDVGGNFDSTTNYRFTVPTGAAGKYLITGQLFYLDPIDAARRFWIGVYKNGTLVALNGAHTANTDGAAAGINVVLELAATDYIELYTYNTFTGTEVLLAGAEYTYMCITRLGT